MKLSELLAVCADDAEMQVMIEGEGIIANTCMLISYLSKDVLNMNVYDVDTDNYGKLKVWVDKR